MTCGVKYCGGCNPRYNRTKLFNEIKIACADIDFQYVQEEVLYDHLLVIYGCPSKCADISKIKVQGDTFKIFEADQLEHLIKDLKMKK